MKPGMMRWKLDPLKVSPPPFSPVQRQRKFSAVFGTASASVASRPVSYATKEQANVKRTELKRHAAGLRAVDRDIHENCLFI